MARKSIFQLLEETYDLEGDASRLLQYFRGINMIKYQNRYYSLKETASVMFPYWKSHGRCVDLEDFLDSVDYKDLKLEAKSDLESFITFIELIYNFWYLVSLMRKKNSKDIEPFHSFSELKKLMDQCLAQYNYEACFFEDKEQVLIIECNPQAIAVAEIVEDELSIDVLRYNHHTLKGDVKAKKAILLAMATELEAQRTELHKINSTLEDDIFFMLNNMNIRHNNIKQGDKKYKEVVAAMQNDELENWYDELYQMMLLAMLELDNVVRKERVKELKQRITAR